MRSQRPLGELQAPLEEPAATGARPAFSTRCISLRCPLDRVGRPLQRETAPPRRAELKTEARRWRQQVGDTRLASHRVPSVKHQPHCSNIYDRPGLVDASMSAESDEASGPLRRSLRAPRKTAHVATARIRLLTQNRRRAPPPTPQRGKASAEQSDLSQLRALKTGRRLIQHLRGVVARTETAKKATFQPQRRGL